MALFQLEARELEPDALPLSRRRRFVLHTTPSPGDVLTCDEIGAVLEPAHEQPEDSEIRSRLFYEVELEPEDLDDEVPLPVLPPPPLLAREGVVLEWMERREALAMRGVGLRAWVDAQPLPSLLGLRIERGVSSTENVLRALDALTTDAAASAQPVLLARSETLDALTHEVHALVELVFTELEELALDIEADWDPWGTAGRSFAEHAATHVLAHIEPRVTALEARCGVAADGAPVLLRVAAGAGWVRRAVRQLSRELRARVA